MKSVLMIAFYFPPRSNIASYRSECFAKFLPEFGWLPTVVCADWAPGRPDFDPQLLAGLPPEVEVCSAANPEPVGGYERLVLRKLAPYVWPHRAPILWWKRARARVVELLACKRFDAIWATSDPLAPWALAAAAAAKSRVPWVADMRDSFNVQNLGSRYKRALYARQERRLALKANRVVTVSEGLAAGLSARIRKSVSVIYNGYDPTLLSSDRASSGRLFTIVYAGSMIIPQRSPRRLLQAVGLCLERGWILRDEIEVQFFGTDEATIRRASPDTSGRIPIRVFPRVSHREIMRVLESGTVLLLLSDYKEKGVLSGKVFDYLGAGRPILVIPDSQEELLRLMQRTGAGVALGDVEAIACQLKRWFSDWKCGVPLMLARNEVEIGRYSRRVQAGQLAELLNGMTSEREVTRLADA